MAGVQKIVADASVLVKWYNIEADTERALQLRRDYTGREIDLVEPYLVCYEVANALRYNPDFGADDVQSAALDLLNTQMDFRLLDEGQVQNAIQLSFKYGVTLYDAVYISLAESERLTLYTADSRLITKVGGPLIKHINSYPEI